MTLALASTEAAALPILLEKAPQLVGTGNDGCLTESTLAACSQLRAEEFDLWHVSSLGRRNMGHCPRAWLAGASVWQLGTQRPFLK